MNKMNIKAGLIKVVLLLTAGALLAACGGPSDEEKAAAAQQAKIKKVVKQVQPADPLAGMSSAVTGSKGTLPVDLRFELLDRPELNKPVNVRLAFVPTIDLFALNAVVKPAAGLQLPDDAPVKFDALKNGEIKEYKFVATPASTGIQLVTVELTVTRDTGDTTFTFSIPIPVPENVAAAAPAANAVSASK